MATQIDMTLSWRFYFWVGYSSVLPILLAPIVEDRFKTIAVYTAVWLFTWNYCCVLLPRCISYDLRTLKDIQGTQVEIKVNWISYHVVLETMELMG